MVSDAEFTAPAPLGARPVEYASFARRLGAALLDSAVWLVGLAFFNPASLVADDEVAVVAISLVIFSLWFNYFALCEWRWGQTIGKNAFGLRVLPLHGGELGWQAAALRNLLRLVDLPLAMVGIDYLIVRGSPRRQRLGDRAAKTIVVRERAPDVVGPAPPPARAGGPPAAELFGDATAALSRQPAAASLPAPAPADQPETAPTEAMPPEIGPGDGQAPRSSWTAAGFPYATWDLRRTVLGVLAGLLIGGLFAPLLVLPFDPDLDSTGALLVAQTLLEVTLVAVSISVASGAVPAGALREQLMLLGLRRFRPSGLGWMLLGLLAYFAFLVAYSGLVGQPEQEDVARDLGLDAGFWAAIPVVVLIAIAAPFAEEVFFRGMLFGGLRRRLATVPAALISALVFGALHATTGVEAIPPLIAFGFVLAVLYERTGSLGPPIVAHLLNNSLALAAT